MRGGKQQHDSVKIPNLWPPADSPVLPKVALQLGRKPFKSPWSLFWFLFASLSSYLRENKQTGFGREIHGQENCTKGQGLSVLRILFLLYSFLG